MLSKIAPSQYFKPVKFLTMSNQPCMDQILNTVIDLIVKKDQKQAIIFLNTFTLTEKDLIFTLLLEKRKYYIEKGNSEKAEKLSEFTGSELGESEKERLIKEKIVGGMYDFNSMIQKIKEYFPEKDDESILQFFIIQKHWHAALRFARDSSLSLPDFFVKERLQSVIKGGYISDVKSVLNYIEESTGTVRKLTNKEKNIFLENAKIYSLEDFLDLEIFLNKSLDSKLLLSKRMQAVKDGQYDQAVILSKLTNKKIKTAELDYMLDKILDNYFSFSDSSRKDERKRLENQLSLNLVKRKKESYLKSNVSDGNMAGAKFLAAELGRQLKVDEFKEIIRYFIFTENGDMVSNVIKEMTKIYPEDAVKLEILS
jgi:hypothetical protein